MDILRRAEPAPGPCGHTSSTIAKPYQSTVTVSRKYSYLFRGNRQGRFNPISQVDFRRPIFAGRIRRLDFPCR
jgi:hypothetical protein